VRKFDSFSFLAVRRSRQFLPSSHSTIKDWELDSFQSGKAQIKDQVSLAKSKIKISSDGWRAPNRDDYLTICAYFIDEDFKLMHCLLVSGMSMGSNLVRAISAGSCWTTLETMILHSRYWQKSFNIDFSRLRCLGHIINLVVKALLLGKGVSKVSWRLE
jgi:hypothetical protein